MEGRNNTLPIAPRGRRGMEVFWEACRLATLPATMSARASVYVVSSGLGVFASPAAQYPLKESGGASRSCPPAIYQKEILTAKPEELRPEWWLLSIHRRLWSALSRCFAKLRSLTSWVFRVTFALLLACILYALPVCGSPLSAPLHLLPRDLGAEGVADADVGLWAAALASGDIVVDIELDLTVPNYQVNLDLTSKAMRVDLALGSKQVSRPLVFPHLPLAVRQLRELIWMPPMVLGLSYDEQAVKLPIATGVSPHELLSGVARVTVTPALVVRSAHLRITPRFAGPLGKLLSGFLGFVPVCAVLLYLALFRKSEAPSPHAHILHCQGEAKIRSQSSGWKGQLTFVEVQMLAKALGGSFNTQFADTLEAFEAEDRAAHRGSLKGRIKIDRLPMILDAAAHEWRVAWNEWELRNIIGTTLTLPASEKGLLTAGGYLHYRQWLAVTSVTLLCGEQKLAVYAEWLEHHASRD